MTVNRKTTRRRFVVGGSGAVAGFLLARSAGASASAPTVVAGTLVRLDSARTAAVRTAGGVTVEVVLGPDAKIERGHYGSIEDLTPFGLGERVVADGEMDGEDLVASRFQSLYFESAGTVTRIENQTAETTAETLFLPSEEERARYSILAQIPILAVGDSFRAEFWRDPDAPHARVVTLQIVER